MGRAHRMRGPTFRWTDSNLCGLLFAVVALRASAVEGETSYDGGAGKEGQKGYSRRTVSFGRPGRAA